MRDKESGKNTYHQQPSCEGQPKMAEYLTKTYEAQEEQLRTNEHLNKNDKNQWTEHSGKTCQDEPLTDEHRDNCAPQKQTRTQTRIRKPIRKPPDMDVLRDRSQLELHISALEDWATTVKASGMAGALLTDIIL